MSEANAGRSALFASLGSGAVQALNAVLGAAWLALIPGLLGAEDYATYVVAAAVLSIGCSINELGTITVYGRLLTEHLKKGNEEAGERLFATTSLYKAIASVLFALIAFIVLRSLTGERLEVTHCALASCAVLLYGAADIFLGVALAHKRSALVAGRGPVQSLFTLGAVGLGYLYGGVQTAVAALALPGMVVLIYSLYISGPRPRLQVSAFSLTHAWQYLKFGVPIALNSFTTMVFSRGGTLILQIVGRQPLEIARYGIAVQLWYATSNLLAHMTNYVIPHLSELVSSDQYSKACKWLSYLERFWMAVASFAFVIIALVGEPLLQLLIGEEYQGIGLVLSVVFFSLIFYGDRTILNLSFIVRKRSRAYLSLWAVLTVTFAGSAIYLSTLFGDIGTGAAMTIGVVVTIVVGRLWHGRKTGMFPRLYRPFLAVAWASVGLIGLAAPEDVRWIAAVAFAALYPVVVLYAGVFTRAERDEVFEAIRG